MSDKKISQLDSLNVASANAVDTLPIVSAGETKKVTLDNLKLILTDLGFEFDELVFVSQNEVTNTPNSIVVSNDVIYFNDGAGNSIEMLLAGSTIQANKVVLTNQTATTGHDPKSIFIKDNALYWTDNSGVAHLIVAENQSPSFNSIKLSNQLNLTGHAPNSILVQDDKLYLVNSSQDALKVILEDSAAKLDKISLNNQASFSGHDSNSIIVKDEEVFYINEANEPSKLLQENSVAVLDKLILTGQTQLTGHATNSIILKDGKLYLVDNQQVAHEIGKPITVTDLGLENVDNTSDANKPVSTLQATAISDAETSAKSYADGLVVGLLNDRGSYDASSNTFPTTGGSGTSGAIKKGDLFFISVAGTLGGSDVTVGDSVRALANAPGQTASKWSIIETNIGYVPEPSITAGTTAQYFRGDKTFQTLDKSAVGLGNVPNVDPTNLNFLRSAGVYNVSSNYALDNNGANLNYLTHAFKFGEYLVVDSPGVTNIPSLGSTYLYNGDKLIWMQSTYIEVDDYWYIERGALYTNLWTFSSTTGTISTSDTVISAINKLDGNINLRQPILPRTLSITSNATITPTFSYDLIDVTALAVATTLANPTGTVVNNKAFKFRLKDNGTAQSIAYGTQYRAIGCTLPSTTTAGKTIYFDAIYNDTDGKMDVYSVEVEGVVAGGSIINQSTKIYIDSVNGVNDTSANRGDINKPYLTPEYALTQINNTGTFTGNTTSGSNVLTSVSSTSAIKIGQFITGTGIPYNTIVLSLTSTTITLSQKCTATGSTITGTWWQVYTLCLNGIFTATSTWQKQGFYIDAGDSVINFGAIILFNITTSQLVPFKVIGGSWYGTHASSQLIKSDYITSNADFIFELNYYFSIGTGAQVYMYNASAFRNLVVDSPVFDCRFGYIATLIGGKATFSGYKYGLLGGFTTYTCGLTLNGFTECPASINAINALQFSELYIYGNITGQLNCSQASMTSSILINGNINGTSHTFRAQEYYTVPIINGDIIGNITIEGQNHVLNFNGHVTGNITNNGSSVLVNVTSLRGAYIGTSNSKARLTSSIKSSYGISAITLTGTSECICNGNPPDTYFNVYNAANQLSVASGCLLTLNNINEGQIIACAGKIINNGYFYHRYKSTNVTGIYEDNGTLHLCRKSPISNTGPAEDGGYTPCISISTGTFIKQGGKIICTDSDSKSGLIRKTASGGMIILKGQPQLKVANGLAPLQILSNTGTAQDIMNFGIIGNGASGFTISDTFSDTTYGTAYAPNNLVSGATNFESTTYNF